MLGGYLSEDQAAGLPSLLVAAHELKAPLGVLRQIGLILSDTKTSEAERSAYQSQLVMTADRALSLVSDLTQVSNLQPTLFPLEPVNPFAVCRAISHEMISMQWLYERQIEWPKSRRNILIVANSKLLERVVANFVNNAVKYTEPGVPISVNVKYLKNRVRIGVRDYGPRISNQDYRRLIDELETTKTLRTRPESSGLGVFLAAQFAKAMHGKIGLIRHQDGLTFYVDMPVSQQLSLV